MSDQSSSPAPPAAAPVGPKKTNKNRAKARAQFDSSAPIIPLERFFSDFQEIRRNNVHVELEPSLLDRLAVPYVDKASDYCDIRLLEETHAKTNIIRATHAMVGFGLVRKLVKSAPASVQPNLTTFKFVADNELYIPPALATAIDAIGKFSTDQFTVRLEYVEQDIVRNTLRILKSLTGHTQFADRYQVGCTSIALSTLPTWDNLNPEVVLYPSISSCRWLRDHGQKMLAETAYKSFDATVKVGNVEMEMKVSFPHLQLSSSRSVQLANIITWIGSLNAELPGINILVAAAVFQIWTPLFFTRMSDPIRTVEPGLTGWVGELTPLSLLRAAELSVLHTIRNTEGKPNWIHFLRDAHAYISGYSRSTFDKFLKLTKQPDTQFGTMAQLLEMDGKAWTQDSSRTVPDFSYRNQRSDMSATCLFKFHEKSLVTSALLFGYSKRVWYTNNQSARLNGSIPSTRLAYVSTDFVSLA